MYNIEEIDLDALISEVKPVMSIKVGGEDYPIYRYDDMPEATALRVTQANSNYEVTNQEVSRVTSDIDKQIEAIRQRQDNLPEDKKDPAANQEITVLIAARVAKETELTRRVREMLEAVIGVPSGTLAKLPPAMLGKVFTQVSEAVFPQEKKSEAQGVIVGENTTQLETTNVISNS